MKLEYWFGTRSGQVDRSEEARQAAIDREQVKKDAAAQKRRDKAAALDSEEEFVEPPEEPVTQNGDTANHQPLPHHRKGVGPHRFSQLLPHHRRGAEDKPS